MTPPAAPTWSLSSSTRKAIRQAVLRARGMLEDDAARQLAALGIDPTSASTKDLEAERANTRDEAEARIAQRVASGETRAQALESLGEEIAYTFFNQLIGIRCLEVRGLLVNDGAPETLIGAKPELKASTLYWQARSTLGSAAKPRALWEHAFEQARAAVEAHIGELYHRPLLFPLAETITGLIELLEALPEHAWQDDEVLGWIYQYYNAAAKDAAYAKLRAKGKLETPQELSAATCLYTERYMVDHLLQNTLGRVWARMGHDVPAHWSAYVPPPEGQDVGSEEAKAVKDLTLLDPASGSGHFLVRAFDLFADLYAAEGIHEPAQAASLILEHNLYGLDIDARAIQIAALGLYLKGVQLAGPDFAPARINLVSADVHLPASPPPALTARFAGDPAASELVAGIWEGLRDAPMLGSLLHPERSIDDALRARAARPQPGLSASEPATAQDFEAYRHELLDAIAKAAAASGTDVGSSLFGEQVAHGVNLIEALAAHYDVVVANPPYAGSGNLDARTKAYVQREYPEGKRDLYAAFILRCLDFSRQDGEVGMVTQQSWMFLGSFERLRRGLLSNSSLETLAHLGARSFEEIGGEIVNTSLLTLMRRSPNKAWRLRAFRLVHLKSAGDKAAVLEQLAVGGATELAFSPIQRDLLSLPGAAMYYWGPLWALRAYEHLPTLGDSANVVEGLHTGDDEQFVRLYWEVWSPPNPPTAWVPYLKEGGYKRWFGLDRFVVNWTNDGKYLSEVGHPIIPNKGLYQKPFCGFSRVAGGKLSFRVYGEGFIFSSIVQAVHAPEIQLCSLASMANARPMTFLLRGLAGGLDFNKGYLAALPVTASRLAEDVGAVCTALKKRLVSRDMTERSFEPLTLVPEAPDLAAAVQAALSRDEAIASVLHALEGWNERLVFDAYELDDGDVAAVLDETGTPAAWHPLVAGYDEPADVEVDLPKGFLDYFASFEREELPQEELAKLKARLVKAYEAGPGAKQDQDDSDDEDAEVLGAHIPIPTETFIEELAVGFKIHPVSVHLLLQEAKAEGTTSPVETKRMLGDWVLVSILRSLGYRWPEQHDEPWTPDADGILPLTSVGTHPTAADRLEEVLETLYGQDGADVSHKAFAEAMGKDLKAYLAKDLFAHQIKRLRSRAIAWHLASPDGSLQVLINYHKLSRDLLQTLRSRYIGALSQKLQGELLTANPAQADALKARIEDLDEFAKTIGRIEAGTGLDAQIRCRWKDEEKTGRPGPYAPDLDDGVKVNVRPFQDLGLLTAKVINKW